MQVTAPPGPVVGTIESLSLGYTIIRVDDGRRVIVPNSTMASQVTVNLNAVTAGPVAASVQPPAAVAGANTLPPADTTAPFV